ncbi:hypothetical protein L873DRAFT_1718885 [Choiromyces venosus 120613-1]|uniref:TPR-like protein n=1 Tax=Choiromyces venosus 120613-1 TaxID=1336337 RepID=A0A3N4IYV7_9PEZI|nr:hypothetical protein L873DRAFT_1718885 [Choiromyces venosus 120613-1]
MYAESERLSRRAQEGREKVLGADHPYTLSSLNRRASILQALGRYGESGRMLRSVLEREEKVLGPNHPSTLTSVNNLACLLLVQGRYAESERLSQRALEGREKVLGADHPYTLGSANNLAHTLEARGRALNPEHYEVYEILERVAGLHEKQRKYLDAEEAYERACTGFSKSFGRKHPTTLECIWKLTTLREKNSALRRISFVQAHEVANAINHRRSPSDRRRHFPGLRRPKQIGGMTVGKRL